MSSGAHGLVGVAELVVAEREIRHGRIVKEPARFGPSNTGKRAELYVCRGPVYRSFSSGLSGSLAASALILSLSSCGASLPAIVASIISCM